MAEISARLKSVSPGAACQEFSLRYGLFFHVLWIRHDSNADLDPGQTLLSQKIIFNLKNMLNLGNRS